MWKGQFGIIPITEPCMWKHQWNFMSLNTSMLFTSPEWPYSGVGCNKGSDRLHLQKRNNNTFYWYKSVKKENSMLNPAVV